MRLKVMILFFDILELERRNELQPKAMGSNLLQSSEKLKPLINASMEVARAIAGFLV